MDPKSKEWEIWCKLDKYWRDRQRKEIEGLSADEIKRTLARAQPSDRGKAGAYVAGEELLKEIEKAKENGEKKTKLYRWIIIGAIGVFLILIFFRGEIDFKKTAVKILDRFGLIALKDSSEKNKPIILESLYQEFKQNVRILRDITYDQQYVSGKMGAQLWNISFSAYEVALSSGAIDDKELATNLRQIYTGIFKVADNAMQATRGADTERQANLYRIIALNHNTQEVFLRKTQQQLEEHITGTAFRNADDDAVGVSNGQVEVAPEGTVYRVASSDSQSVLKKTVKI